MNTSMKYKEVKHFAFKSKDFDENWELSHHTATLTPHINTLIPHIQSNKTITRKILSVQIYNSAFLNAKLVYWWLTRSNITTT